MTSHPFNHLGKTWTLSKRNDSDTAPWYFTPRWGDHKQKVFHCLRDKETWKPLPTDKAVLAAKQYIDERWAGKDQYEKLRAATKLMDNVTVSDVLDKWIAAAYPEPGGRPRPAHQATRHSKVIKYPRQWFADKPVSLVNEPLLVKYAHWRRGKTREGYAGDRIIDREMNTLVQCFYWATAAGVADKNPFLERPRFQTADQVKHASAFMPSSDDELHRRLGWLITTGEPAHILAAAQLLFMALTGLRSGEPGFLRWNARYLDSGPECGHRFSRTIEGKTTELLAIRRLKGGINPAVVVHPALASFIAAWQPYCRMHWPDSECWFPHPEKTPHGKKERPLVLPEDPCAFLNWRLEAASVALGLPKTKAHSMRAFYVRVRRSQGASDSTIAEELGQGSGPGLIVTTYGRADQIRGDARFDWLPSAEVAIAWSLLQPARTNIIAL